MNRIRPYFKKTDLIIIALVLLVSAASFIFLGLKIADNDTPAKAEIRVNTKLSETIDLTRVTEPYEVTVDGNFPVTLEISSDGVRFIESQCPDKLCIHSGLIKANQSAACLPAGVSVTVKGEGKTEVDTVVG